MDMYCRNRCLHSMQWIPDVMPNRGRNHWKIFFFKSIQPIRSKSHTLFDSDPEYSSALCEYLNWSSTLADILRYSERNRVLAKMLYLFFRRSEFYVEIIIRWIWVLHRCVLFFTSPCILVPGKHTSHTLHIEEQTHIPYYTHQFFFFLRCRCCCFF